MNSKILCLLLCYIAPNVVFAETEHREQGVHQHGIATLNIAVSQPDLVIELETPAYNILGFEHLPHNPEQQQYVTKQLTTLKSSTLFELDTQATCLLQSVDIHSPFEIEEHAEEANHHHAEEHAEEEANHHHAEEHAEEADHHDAEEHHTHETAEVHTDIEVKYHYQCQSMPISIEINKLFKQFPQFEMLHAQWVTDTLQSAQDLTPNSSLIQLR